MNSQKVLNLGTIAILLGASFVTGTALLDLFIGSNIFISVTNNIVTVVNFVYDLIFSSLNLLSFFVRPSTLSIVAHLFIAYWTCWIEFKFLIACTKITIKAFECAHTMLNSATNIVSKIFIRS